MLKCQTSSFKSEQVAPSSKRAGMRLCFLSPSMRHPPPSPVGSFFLKDLVLPVLLPSLPASELRYYQQSAF